MTYHVSHPYKNRQNYSSQCLNITLFIWICPFYPKICDKSKNIGCACTKCRSQWPRAVRGWSVASHLLGLWVRIPPGAWISCECCVLSRICLCVGLTTRPEEPYRVRCVWVGYWSLSNEGLAHWGLLHHAGGGDTPNNRRSNRNKPYHTIYLQKLPSSLAQLVRFMIHKPLHKKLL